MFAIVRCAPEVAVEPGRVLIAPQTGMEKPGTTNGAKPDGSMGTAEMSSVKGVSRGTKEARPPRKTGRHQEF